MHDDQTAIPPPEVLGLPVGVSDDLGQVQAVHTLADPQSNLREPTWRLDPLPARVLDALLGPYPLLLVVPGQPHRRTLGRIRSQTLQPALEVGQQRSEAVDGVVIGPEEALLACHVRLVVDSQSANVGHLGEGLRASEAVLEQGRLRSDTPSCSLDAGTSLYHDLATVSQAVAHDPGHMVSGEDLGHGFGTEGGGHPVSEHVRHALKLCPFGIDPSRAFGLSTSCNHPTYIGTYGLPAS